MKISHFVRRLAAVAPLLLATALPVRAHNGSFARAAPAENIVVDSEFSDWPANLPHYPIDLLYTMDDLSGPEDYRGAFRLAYNAAANALYVAIEVDDEFTVINTRKEDLYLPTQDSCDIFINVQHNRFAQQLNWGKKVHQYVMWGDIPNLFGRGTRTDVEVATRRLPGKPYYEWRLDLNKISQNQVQIAPGMVLELEVAIWNCDEDGSCTFLTWGKDGGKGGNPNSRGDVLLVSDPDELVALRGKLLWQDSDQSISLARVDVHSTSNPHTRLRLETDQNGHFIAQLPPGQYRVGSHGIGHEKQPGTAVILPLQDNGEIDDTFTVLIGIADVIGQFLHPFPKRPHHPLAQAFEDNDLRSASAFLPADFLDNPLLSPKEFTALARAIAPKVRYYTDKMSQSIE